MPGPFFLMIATGLLLSNCQRGGGTITDLIGTTFTIDGALLGLSGNSSLYVLQERNLVEVADTFSNGSFQNANDNIAS
jgi:hypothetical protein